MNITFNGKTAVVTGATGGIGSTIAKTLLESGAQVALIDISPDRLAETQKQLSVYGNVKGYPLNVADTLYILQNGKIFRAIASEDFHSIPDILPMLR